MSANPALPFSLLRTTIFVYMTPMVKLKNSSSETKQRLGCPSKKCLSRKATSAQWKQDRNRHKEWLFRKTVVDVCQRHICSCWRGYGFCKLLRRPCVKLFVIGRDIDFKETKVDLPYYWVQINIDRLRWNAM